MFPSWEVFSWLPRSAIDPLCVEEYPLSHPSGHSVTTVPGSGLPLMPTLLHWTNLLWQSAVVSSAVVETAGKRSACAMLPSAGAVRGKVRSENNEIKNVSRH
jgi:hypothetical protein